MADQWCLARGPRANRGPALRPRRLTKGSVARHAEAAVTDPLISPASRGWGSAAVEDQVVAGAAGADGAAFGPGDRTVRGARRETREGVDQFRAGGEGLPHRDRVLPPVGRAVQGA